MSALPPDRREHLRAFIPAETAQKILAAGVSQERRLVTALFCDVVGSTALGERFGPERFKVVMDQVLGRIIEAVARYEGTVAQLMGDGVLAFFGAPLAHEDDPERAVRAALDVRDAVGAFSSELQAAYGVPLQVRAGLNTGAVVLSRITDVLEVAYNALGDTVNTAARLQSAAAAGTILASAATAGLVEPLFDLRPVGSLTLKGKGEPLEAFEVVGSRAVTGKVRGIVGLTSPLVGRDGELAQLDESVRAVVDGRGQIAAVIGEAGIGKSRLVADVARSHPEVRWLEGRCLSYAGAIPYFPFIDLIREWLGITAGDPDAKVRIELRTALESLVGTEGAAIYPYLTAMLGVPLEREAAARLADLSPESLRHQTFRVIRRWAESLSAAQPLGLILDDLHWADGTSLTLLEDMLEITEQAPLLLCLLFRPERDHASWRLNELARQRFSHRHIEIMLRPLASTDTERLVTNLLALPEFSPTIRTLILEKAEGNPFFVEEVIRALIGASVLVREGTTWRSARAITALDIPDSIQGVLLARIDRLSDQAKRVLQAASVIGRLFLLDTLREMLHENGTVDAAVVDLQRHDLVVERRRIPRPEYRFKHALTQEVAYSTLTDAERLRLHRELAQALEAQYMGRLEEVYGLLAYHYDRAGTQDRAIHFLVHAGDKARAEYAEQEALRYYARAVELMTERQEWDAAARTLMKAALAHHIAFDFEAADRAYRQAFTLLERVPAAPALHPSEALRMSVLEPAGVDITRNSDAPSIALACQMFEGLLRWTPDDNIVPAIARSWEITDQGRRYRFHLHRDRVWSDGRGVTAHDFVFSWRRAMRGVNNVMFEDIVGAHDYSAGRTDDPESVGVRAADDYTLELTLEGPRSYFPFVLAHAVALPQPRRAIEAHPEEWERPPHLVANGPFIMHSWEPGRSVRLTLNPLYRGPRSGNVKDLIFVVDRPDDPASFADGKVDVQVPTHVEPDYLQRFRDSVRLEPPYRLLLIFLRTDRPPFSDRRVRLAFAHATDRRRLETLTSRHLIPADGGAVPPALPGHSPGIGIPYDPEAARRLLADAGYPGGRGLGPFFIPIPSRLEANVVDAVAQGWREVLDVQISLKAVPASEFWAEMYRDPPDIGRIAWIADYPDPDNVLRVVFHSGSDHNYGRFHNETFDRLVEQARSLTDQRQRMQLYHKADELLVAEEAAIIPLAYTRTITLVQPWIKGWQHWGVSAADLTVDRP